MVRGRSKFSNILFHLNLLYIFFHNQPNHHPTGLNTEKKTNTILLLRFPSGNKNRGGELSVRPSTNFSILLSYNNKKNVIDADLIKKGRETKTYGVCIPAQKQCEATPPPKKWPSKRMHVFGMMCRRESYFSYVKDTTKT